MHRFIPVLAALALTACVAPKKPGESWYRGGAVPEGHHIQRRADPDLFGGGVSTIATGYLLPMFPVAFTLLDDHPNKDKAALNFIPVVGPLIFVHTVPPNEQPIVGGGREYVMAYTSAMTQLGGLALLIAAQAGARPALVAPRASKITVAPVPVGPDGAGVVVAGRF